MQHKNVPNTVLSTQETVYHFHVITCTNLPNALNLMTCVLGLCSFGMMDAELQVEELHNFLFESSPGPNVGPDVQYWWEQFFPQSTHPHPTVHCHSFQEGVKRRDNMLQNSQMFLMPDDNRRKERVILHRYCTIFLHSWPLPRASQSWSSPQLQGGVGHIKVHYSYPNVIFLIPIWKKRRCVSI